jgi:hypothetical protein
MVRCVPHVDFRIGCSSRDARGGAESAQGSITRGETDILVIAPSLAIAEPSSSSKGAGDSGRDRHKPDPQ